MPYLTPDSPPETTITVSVEIPESDDWRAILFGALAVLLFADNFEEFGDLTPQETADIWAGIFDNITES